MHILVSHGYLLHGTGSNIYVQNICREFCRKGHNVSIVSQESRPQDFDFIAESFEFNEDNKEIVQRFSRDKKFSGKCIHYKPYLGGFLPVYVYDHYEGFEVKEFTDLSKTELEQYISHNARAIKSITEERNADLAISNHTIMQPIYSSRALDSDVNHFMVVHGSALNFSVKKSPLLLEYAREGIENVDKIIFVSNYYIDEFKKCFPQETTIDEKAAVIPAGVDLNLFKPLGSGESKNNRIHSFLEREKEKILSSGGISGEEKEDFYNRVVESEGEETLNEVIKGFTSRKPLQPDKDLFDNLSKINFDGNNIILYYGKHLWTKGVHIILAAAPLILKKHPDAYFIIVGFGGFRSYLQSLLALLDSGKRDLVKRILSYPQNLSFNVGEEFHTTLPPLLRGDEDDEYYFRAAKNIKDRVIFTGYLPHESLRELIPCADIVVAPSIYPEAFGMVAVEALASGVIPMQTYHSGFAEVVDSYVGELRDTFDTGLLNHLYLDEDLVFNIANNTNVFLDYFNQMSKEEYLNIRWRARNVTVSLYSWATIADKYLEVVNENK